MCGENAEARDLVFDGTASSPNISADPTTTASALLRRWPAQGQDLKHGRRAI
jgi:hypothetical protein